MAVVLAAANYSRGGFSLCLAGSARRVMVPVGSSLHLEPGTIHLSVCPYVLPSVCLFPFYLFSSVLPYLSLVLVFYLY